LYEIQGHKKWITGISWEPVHLNAPCRRFVSASKDGDARIWDVSLKKFIILSGHTLAVTCVKWGGDGVIYTGYFSFFSSNFSKDFIELFSSLNFLYCMNWDISTVFLLLNQVFI
jgi:WD40 repeat protein